MNVHSPPQPARLSPEQALARGSFNRKRDVCNPRDVALRSGVGTPGQPCLQVGG
jgi:hypothetical protein